MKYGMRERISGAVILVALAIIFVPMLFDEPAPRDERPQPVFTIEQPVPVERRDVPDPQPPASLGQIRTPDSTLVETPVESGDLVAETEPQVHVPPVVEPPQSAPAQAAQAPAVVTQPAPQPSTPPATQAQPTQADPIADLARQASQRIETAQAPSQAPAAAPSPSAAAGEWAVQVGSFGEAGNAERLQARLREQGFSAYSRRRDNNMTTVYVGPYASSEAGERAMTELKEQANLQGLLVRVRE